ncbi:MAG TPA: protein kinase [Thermoanaerobaculia bacterium]|jgi:Tol biopolymer transport system component|nr:protein kinase [Thermoanaerobaculia bacterium]
MRLRAGSRLGPYEILSPLGAGGMGEVYRGRDSRLGREVAIKILPEEFAGDSERLRRFEGEARAASALSDPHIVTVFDVGAAEGVHFFATELVDGTELRALMGEPMPVRKMLDLAGQIASGLAAAHEKGIVHRDLKPENVLISKTGLAKIADFGLAKFAQSADAGVSQLPTSDGAATAPGIVMGTVAYMSPEQARGAAVDVRSDQFSFGSILHEMLTGRPAFRRGSAAETLSAILREDPEALPSSVPPPLRWIVERCLAKDAGQRYASTRDLARDLATLRERLPEAASTAVAVSPARPRRGARAKRAAIAAALLASWAGVFLATRVRRSPAPSFQRLTFRRGTIGTARFTPDGKTIAYSASWDGAPEEIFTARVESPESRPLGLPDSGLFACSASGELAIAQKQGDGRGRALAQVSLGGGAPRTLVENVTAADWSPKGDRLAVGIRAFGTVMGEAADHVEYPPGTTVFKAKRLVGDVRISPSGDRLAILDADEDGRGDILVIDTRGKTLLTTRVWGSVAGLAWAPKKDEIWFSAAETGTATSLRAMDRSGKVRQVAGIPGAVTLKDISRDGRVLLSRDTIRSQLAGLFPDRAQEVDLSWLDAPWISDISADGRTLLFTESGEGAGAVSAVYLRKTDGSPAVRLGEGSAIHGGLSPDGKWVLATPLGSTDPPLLLLPTGAGEARRLSLEPLVERDGEAVSWFPDSRRFTVCGMEKGHKRRCWSVDIESGKARPLTPEGVQGVTWWAPVSPDGKTMLVTDARNESRAPGGAGGSTAAFYSLETGEIRPVKGWGAAKATRCVWSPDGRAILTHTHEKGGGTKLARFDIAGGRWDVIKQLSLGDSAGQVSVIEPVVTPDGKWYAYSYFRNLGDLYLADGLR